jgi:hypothetical protein
MPAERLVLSRSFRITLVVLVLGLLIVAMSALSMERRCRPPPQRLALRSPQSVESHRPILVKEDLLALPEPDSATLSVVALSWKECIKRLQLPQQRLPLSRRSDSTRLKGLELE